MIHKVVITIKATFPEVPGQDSFEEEIELAVDAPSPDEAAFRVQTIGNLTGYNAGDWIDQGIRVVDRRKKS